MPRSAVEVLPQIPHAQCAILTTRPDALALARDRGNLGPCASTLTLEHNHIVLSSVHGFLAPDTYRTVRSARVEFGQLV